MFMLKNAELEWFWKSYVNLLNGKKENKMNIKIKAFTQSKEKNMS